MFSTSWFGVINHNLYVRVLCDNNRILSGIAFTIFFRMPIPPHFEHFTDLLTFIWLSHSIFNGCSTSLYCGTNVSTLTRTVALYPVFNFLISFIPHRFVGRGLLRDLKGRSLFFYCMSDTEVAATAHCMKREGTGNHDPSDG